MGGDLKQEGQGPVAGVEGFDLGRWGRVGKGREMRREDRKEGCWPYKGTWGRTSCEGCGGKGAGQRGPEPGFGEGNRGQLLAG